MNAARTLSLAQVAGAGALRLLDEIASQAPAHRPDVINRPVVLYGAGSLGRLAAEVLASLQIPIAYAVDRSPPTDGLLLGRIPVKHPEQVSAVDRAECALLVCVVLYPYAPIAHDLQDMGWQHVYPFYDAVDAYSHLAPLNNGWFAGRLDDGDQAQIAQVLSTWHDDHSRAAHLQFLAWRVLRQEWRCDQAPVTTHDRYFIPPVLAALGPSAVFLDGGAWHGEVSQRFLESQVGQCAQIVAIEPDRQNFVGLTAWAAGLPEPLRARLRLLDCALGAQESEEVFAQGHGMTSRLMSLGDERLAVRTIDSLNTPFSFIKLHLEGGELAALRGALTTLLQTRPVLAVTVYHNRDGLSATAAWLMAHLPDYRFLFRLHAWCGTGAVLYALPKENH